MPYKDREKRRVAARAQYKNNPGPSIARANESRRRRRAEFASYKATLSCAKCGESHPATLDFHHHTPHQDNIKIVKLVRANRIKFAMEEIMRKCIVLCSNCHRKHHWDERLKKEPHKVALVSDTSSP